MILIWCTIKKCIMNAVLSRTWLNALSASRNVYHILIATNSNISMYSYTKSCIDWPSIGNQTDIQRLSFPLVNILRAVYVQYGF